MRVGDFFWVECSEGIAPFEKRNDPLEIRGYLLFWMMSAVNGLRDAIKITTDDPPILVEEQVGDGLTNQIFPEVFGMVFGATRKINVDDGEIVDFKGDYPARRVEILILNGDSLVDQRTDSKACVTVLGNDMEIVRNIGAMLKGVRGDI